MKARVNRETCIGCGMCVDICPKVFRMSDDKAAANPDAVPKDAEETCKQAAEGCPVGAIDVTE